LIPGAVFTPVRDEVGCACVAREVSIERGGMGERGCAGAVFEGTLAGSVTRWPLRRKEWLKVFSFSPMYNGDSAALRLRPLRGRGLARPTAGLGVGDLPLLNHHSFFLAAVPRPIKFAFSR